MQFEERAQERLLLLAVSLYLLEIVRSAHHGAQGDDQNVKKLMLLAPIYAKIGNVLKEGLTVHQAKVSLICYSTPF